MFFRSLGYSTLCVYGVCAFGTSFLENQQSEDQVALSTLFHLQKYSSKTPLRDFSSPRHATLSQIFHKNIKPNSSKGSADKNDKVSRNETARYAYCLFLNFKGNEDF